MKGFNKYIFVAMLLLFFISPFLVTTSYALSDKPAVSITKWEMMWEEDSQLSVDNVLTSKDSDWVEINYGDQYPKVPKEIHTAWIKFKLPELAWTVPALSINKIYAQNIEIFISNEKVFESNRDYAYDKYQILLPLSKKSSNTFVVMKISTFTDRIGLQDVVTIGEYRSIAKKHMILDLADVILGASLIIISIAMVAIMFFLNKDFIKGLRSLGLVIFSTGIMILTYSPFIHNSFSEYGYISYYLFDIFSTLLIPSLFFYIEKIFGRGPYGLIKHFRNFQLVVSLISIIWLLVSFKWDMVYGWYAYASAVFFAISIVFGNLLFVGSLIIFSRKGNKDAIIMSAGLILFAAIGSGEILWYFSSGKLHLMFYWKLGVLAFITSLVVILARRFSQNYEQVLRYSKQLEVFNNELQRSEKMEIISQLAASVAHEVRNPLQVTRGFLQLLGAKSKNDKDKSYMVLAIDELDRASEIITDFLTFAKPQLENNTLLDIREELHQIEGILIPLATMQGGIIDVKADSGLLVRGNTSKLKQALINIIKNSIESFGSEGRIEIKAYQSEDSNQVFISIKDNGEGISEEDLKKLGEPYYSKKSKGTGLGLMVTFRIIEAMQGKIIFKSTKGVGTTVTISLPLGINK
ncbi:ATP-binding protein [Paenibacillus sp. 2TAB23]|uniref:ATP-binding protein n=1 Tax=Paenibacillus sp. 2TAB23 TaxID=3233004 RepID=UPI003F98D57B